MRTREEQITELVDALKKPVCRPDYPVSILEDWLEHHLLEAERRAEQRVRAEISKRHTWFYMIDDPESSHADLADMLRETRPFEIVETSEAADIRIFFAYQDEEGEIHEFSTRADAEQAARKAIDAARENNNDFPED